MVHLCKCNNCDTILIDQNPSNDSSLFKETELPENVEEMQYIEDTEGGFWACPVCGTDDYLIDL